MGDLGESEEVVEDLRVSEGDLGEIEDDLFRTCLA